MRGNERSVPFDPSEVNRATALKMDEWKKAGWKVPEPPKDRPAGNVVTLPLGGEYVANVLKKENEQCPDK
jgi:hypothetical protein